MDQPNLHPEFKNIQNEFQQRIKSVAEKVTPEREKEILKQMMTEKFQAVPQPQTQVQTDNGKETEEFLPAASPDPKTQYQYAIDSLISTAFEKGLTKAVQEARETHNAFLIDAFHDELVDRFYVEINSMENG